MRHRSTGMLSMRFPACVEFEGGWLVILAARRSWPVTVSSRWMLFHGRSTIRLAAGTNSRRREPSRSPFTRGVGSHSAQELSWAAKPAGCAQAICGARAPGTALHRPTVLRPVQGSRAALAIDDLER